MAEPGAARSLDLFAAPMYHWPQHPDQAKAIRAQARRGRPFTRALHIATPPRSGTWYLKYTFAALDRTLAGGKPFGLADLSARVRSGAEELPHLGINPLSVAHWALCPGYACEETPGKQAWIELTQSLHWETYRDIVASRPEFYSVTKNPCSAAAFVFRHPLHHFFAIMRRQIRLDLASPEKRPSWFAALLMRLKLRRDPVALYLQHLHDLAHQSEAVARTRARRLDNHFPYARAGYGALNELSFDGVARMFIPSRWMDCYLLSLAPFFALRARAPERVALVRYGDMMAAPHETFSRLLGLVDIDVDARMADALSQATALTRQDRMRQFEAETGAGLALRADSHFTAAPMPDWKAYLAPDIRAHIRSRLEAFALPPDFFEDENGAPLD
jgi:hypothetical protein